jgi:hypothetical protein
MAVGIRPRTQTLDTYKLGRNPCAYTSTGEYVRADGIRPMALAIRQNKLL